MGNIWINFALLQLSKRLQNKNSPGHSEIEIPDKSEELSAHDGVTLLKKMKALFLKKIVRYRK